MGHTKPFSENAIGKLTGSFIWKSFAKVFFLLLLAGSSWRAMAQPVLLAESAYTIDKVGPVVYFNKASKLWKTDGTVEGTSMVKDIAGIAYTVGVLNQYLFFRVGNDLWRTDGTEAGTILLADIVAMFGSIPSNTAIGYMGSTNTKIFFGVSSGGDGTIGYSDGTPGGTVNTTMYAYGQSIGIGDKIFYGRRNVLFVTDGVTFTELRSFPGAEYGTISTLNEYNGELTFVVQSGIHGSAYNLWKSDGTVEGTNFVINPVNLSNPGPLVDHGPDLTTVWSNPKFGSSIYYSRPGGLQVYNGSGFVSIPAAGGPGFLGVYDGGASPIYARAGATGALEIWQTDGTVEGSTLIKTLGIEPNPNGLQFSYIYYATTDGDDWFFTRYRSTDGPVELWRSDGTSEGTGGIARAGYSLPIYSVGNRIVYQGPGGLLSIDSQTKFYQEISFNSPAAKTFGDENFDLVATSTAGFPVTFTSSNEAVATIAGNTVTIVGAGTTVLTASQAGNESYAAALPKERTLQVLKSQQTITFEPLPERLVTDEPFDLVATTTSGLPITFSVINASIASIEGNTVTIHSAGTTSVTASQAGNANYFSASLTRSLTIAKLSQEIIFAELPEKMAGDPDFAPGATASSGLSITYISSNTTVASISAGKIHVKAAGTTTISAYQSGDDTYAAATFVQRTLTVIPSTRQDQTITFGTIPGKTILDEPFQLDATASSGLPVSYSSSNTAVATISGNTVTIVGLGSSQITASQDGNAEYNSAQNVTQNLTVTKQSQTITFNLPATKQVDDPPFALTATASSGLDISYSSGNTAVATVAGSTITILGVGTSVITASQAGNDKYYPAANTPRVLTVTAGIKTDQAITFAPIETKTMGADPFTLGATASSGLAVSYSSGNTAVATISNNTVTIVGAGTSVITASQPGNDDFNPAPPVTQTLTVEMPGNETIPHFDYHKVILGTTPVSLQVSLQSKNATTGEVSINGGDSQAPQVPFTWIWGDGSTSDTFFPGTHTYSNKTKNYIVAVVANYPDNKKDTVYVLVDFVPIVMDEIALDPKTRVFIPATPFSFAGTRLYTPPALTEFSDNAFTSFTRSQTEYILSIASGIGYEFVNHAAFLYDGKFEQFMLRDASFAGAYSIWYTNPVGFGVNDSFLSGGDIDFSSLTHEMGHNYTLNIPADFYYGGNIDGSGNAIFSESMANIFAHAVGYQLLNHAESYGIGEDVHLRLRTKYTNSAKVIRTAYDRYLANNKPFASWNDPATPTDETFDTFMTIAYKFMEHAELENQGYREPFKRMIAVLEQFNEGYATQYDPQNNNAAADAFRATLMVAALSNAFDTDLRQEFIDLNFPINDAVFIELIDGAEKQQQTITFNALPTKMLGDEPLELTASASSGLTVTYTSSNTNVATINGNILTIVGVGSSVITASQEGNSGYEPAAPVERTLEVIANNRENQTLTFGSLPTKTYGDAPFLLTASSTSENPIVYTSSNVAVATISGGEVTIAGAGTSTITASQASNADFNAATPVSQVLTVNKASQTITFPAIATKVFGDEPFIFDVSLNSELPLSYSSSDPLVASIEASGQVTIHAAGTTTVTVSQDGDDNHNAATDATQVLTVSKASQSITFTALTNKTLGAAAFTLEATASSDLQVAFSTQSDKVTIAGTQATPVKAGRLSILADQAGNDNYLAADQAEQSICINPAKPTITANDSNPESPILTSSSTSGNKWFLDGAPIDGAVNQTLTITDIGSYTVKVQVDDCMSETSAAMIIVVTGLDRAHDDIMSAYPNPARNELVVRWGASHDRQVIMLDVVGRQLETKSMSTGEIIFNVENLPKGTYLLKGVGSQTIKYFKFVKE